MFFILIAIQAVLIIYGSQSLAGAGDGGSIWSFIMNMDRWGSLTFALAIVGIAAGIGLVGIIAASTFGFKTDFLIFAPAIAGFISLGVVFTNLAMFLKSQLISMAFMCDPHMTGTVVISGVVTPMLTYCMSSQATVANFIIGIIIGPLAFYYVWTILEYWRGKDF
jgi:hypothetical protein